MDIWQILFLSRRQRSIYPTQHHKTAKILTAPQRKPEKRILPRYLAYMRIRMDSTVVK
jgi:hypothetical protein